MNVYFKITFNCYFLSNNDFCMYCCLNLETHFSDRNITVMHQKIISPTTIIENQIPKNIDDQRKKIGTILILN